MIIKSLTIENFRQFKDRKTIPFATSGKNVTVFLGNISRGKSTLIQAFLWAIYNKDKPDLPFPEDILNKESLSKMILTDKQTVSVQVELTHGGVDYTFLRECTYQCKDRPGTAKLIDDVYKVWYTENGQTIQSTQPIATREKILPEDLSEYFFFDGEHIKKLNKNKKLKESISKLLGLLPLQNAVKDLEKVHQSIENSIPKTGNQELDAATRRKTTALKGIEIQEELRKRIEVAYNTSKDAYDKAQQQLSDFKTTTTLIENRKTQEGLFKSKTAASQMKLVDCSRKFNSAFFDVLLQNVYADTLKLVEDIKEDDLANEGIPFMHADSVKYILEHGKCICGADLNSHPELVKNIKALGNLLPPNSIGTELAGFVSQLEVSKGYVDSVYEAFSDSVKDYYSVLREADTAQNTVKELDLQLNGVDFVAIDDIRKAFFDSEKAVKLYGDQLKDIDYAIRDYKKDLKNAQKDIDDLIGQDEMYKKPRVYSKYAAQLAIDIDKTRGAKESNMLQEFRSVLDEVFNSMYNGSREVIVDENYNVHLIVPGHGELSASEGTESVLGFAYVCTLLKLALSQIDDPELASEPHALVMDAPTSTQGDDDIPSVFKYTITVADQIILFINHKDWNYVKPVLESKIDMIYELDKKNEIYTVVKEVNQ